MAERLTPITRTSFALTDREAFDGALVRCLRWLETIAGVKLPADSIEGASFESGERSVVAAISASRLDDPNGRIWAARVNYIGDKIAPRQWITDLFVESRIGDITRFGAQLVCRHDEHDDKFEHSRPRIIRDIIAEFSAEADGVALENEFLDISEDHVEDFVHLLTKSDRRLPIVLISTDFEGGAQLDLERLAKRISGTAHLKTMGVDACYELSRFVGKKMSTFNGAVRVYLPNVDLRSEDHLRHPLWLAPSSGWNPRAAHEISSRVLPSGFRDAEGGTRFWRLGLLRQAASRAEADAVVKEGDEKLRAELSAIQAELKNKAEEAQTAESLMYDEARKAEEAQAEAARLLEENFALRQRVKGVETGGAVATILLQPDDVRLLADGSPTLECSLNVISSIFPERITVLASAIESARDSISFLHRKKAFDLMWSLATDYHQALSSGESDSIARKCFGNSYAAKEKETLSKAGRDRRTFEYKGISLEMMRHLKIGVADNRADTLRVHFEWVASEGRIVIGHCGAHLDF